MSRYFLQIFERELYSNLFHGKTPENQDFGDSHVEKYRSMLFAVEKEEKTKFGLETLSENMYYCHPLRK